MAKIAVVFGFFLTLGFLSACASVQDLPASASQVDFEITIEGKADWARQERSFVFEGEKIEDIFDAAKAGLSYAGFSVKKADFSERVVIGEHGVTWVDWNVIAGVYMMNGDDSVIAKVISQGSKDIGFAGDQTGDNWTGKVIVGMRYYLRDLKEQQ